MPEPDIMQLAREYIQKETNEVFRKEVEALVKAGDTSELSNRFYQDLDFGTGGMRGEIGGGYNRMNTYMVQKATQGLANYINRAVTGGSAVIAYDSRHYSDVFSLEAALVLGANGIKTYLFTGLRPTPELSFAVRRLKATAGIVITASHNPKEYNGYKVYWDDGGQIVPPHDKGIITQVRAVKEIKKADREQMERQGMLVMIDREVDEPFIQAIMDAAIRPDLIKEKGRDLTVVYSPLNGSGTVPVATALEKMGIAVELVPEQKDPDGDFPTTPKPNPEEREALALALKLGAEKKADLVMATDPDADRLGIAIPVEGEYILISGNQLGSLLADYIMHARQETGTMPKNPVFIKTIVTTELQRKIAEHYGVKSVDVLTGFKYIGEKIKEFESLRDPLHFVFGGEESYGYLVHTQARDKDAVSAATMTAEMALYHVSQGRSLMEQLKVLWQKYGYYEEVLISQNFKGAEGARTMAGLMDKLRTNPPVEFAGGNVAFVKDYQKGTTLTVGTGKTQKDIDLPKSNVIQLILEDETVVTARPSGTEPKIKFYASAHSAPGMDLHKAQTAVGRKLQQIKAEIDALIAGV